MGGIKNFKDKVIVITGAGSGIGRATALAFAAEGADLIISDKAGDRLAAVGKEIERLGARVLMQEMDVSDRAQVEELANLVIKERGKVDILHNNAGVSIGARFEDTSLEDWEWIVSINMWGVIYGIHYFLPHMIRQRYGHIVNTSSVMGLCATPGTPAYCTTKFAIAGLSEAIRAEVRRYNIGVTAICPGVIDTRVVEDGRMRLREGSKATREKVVEFYQKHGWPPERVARAVLKAVRKNKAVVPVGPEAWAQWYAKRLSQTIYNFICVISEKYLM